MEKSIRVGGTHFGNPTNNWERQGLMYLNTREKSGKSQGLAKKVLGLGEWLKKKRHT